MWLQGGPGASSLLGLLYEHGALRFEEGAPAGAEPEDNPLAWNLKANVVYIDQPFGTGFSYAEDEADLVTDLKQMAAHLRSALLDLVANKQPWLNGKPLWLSGESYAGKYVPHLATAILGEPLAQLNLKGLLMGDPWTDPPHIVATYADYSKAHGLVGDAGYKALLANNTEFQSLVEAKNWSAATNKEHAMEAFVEATAGVNAYDVRRGPYDFGAATAYLNDPKTRAGLNLTDFEPRWALVSEAVSATLHDDIAKPAAHLMPALFDNPDLIKVIYTVRAP